MDKVLFFGRCIKGEALSGSEKFMKRIFQNSKDENHHYLFVDFYFGYRPLTIFKKLFGYEELELNNGIRFVRLGLFKIFSLIRKNRIRTFVLNGLEGYATFIFFVMKKFYKLKLIYVVHGVYKYELIYDKLGIEPTFYKWKYSLIESEIIKSSDVLFVFSESTIMQLKDYFGQWLILHRLH